jgi:molybdopterin-biosynthesis enzyme MoeA-like protein
VSGSGRAAGGSAAVLVIGAEQLRGEVQDANTATIARYLATRQLSIGEVRFVRDDRVAIAAAIRDLRPRFALVVAAGGLGPTHDDVTAASVAHALGIDLVVNPFIVEILVDAQGFDAVTATRLAMVPSGCRLVENPDIGPFGFLIENLLVLPGVPDTVRAMLKAMGEAGPEA